VTERKPFIGSKTVWFTSELIQAHVELAVLRHLRGDHGAQVPERAGSRRRVTTVVILSPVRANRVRALLDGRHSTIRRNGKAIMPPESIMGFAEKRVSSLEQAFTEYRAQAKKETQA